MCVECYRYKDFNFERVVFIDSENSLICSRARVTSFIAALAVLAFMSGLVSSTLVSVDRMIDWLLGISPVTVGCLNFGSERFLVVKVSELRLYGRVDTVLLGGSWFKISVVFG